MTNHINITKQKGDNYLIASTSDFFKGTDYVSVIYTGESIILHKHYLEIPKKAKKLTKNNNSFAFSVNSTEPIPLGKHYFSEDETTEDVAVINL